MSKVGASRESVRTSPAPSPYKITSAVGPIEDEEDVAYSQAKPASGAPSLRLEEAASMDLSSKSDGMGDWKEKKEQEPDPIEEKRERERALKLGSKHYARPTVRHTNLMNENSIRKVRVAERLKKLTLGVAGTGGVSLPPRIHFDDILCSPALARTVKTWQRGSPRNTAQPSYVHVRRPDIFKAATPVSQTGTLSYLPPQQKLI